MNAWHEKHDHHRRSDSTPRSYIYIDARPIVIPAINSQHEEFVKQ